MQNFVEKINQISLKFLNAESLDKLYSVIVDEALSLTDSVYGTIVLQKGGYLERTYTNSPIIFKTKNRVRGNMYKSFKDREIIVFKPDTDLLYHQTLRKHNIKTSFIIPLYYRGKALGVLFLDSEKELEITQELRDALKLFASMTALAIRKYQLLEETKKALELRDLFISLAAHELRTPLTSVTVYAQMLEKRLKGKNTSESRWISELTGELARLTTLLQDLLQVSNIKAHGQLTYSLEECSLQAILDDAIKRFRIIRPERELIYENKIQNIKDKIIGDPSKLLQVFYNLLDNAAKYSNPDTTIHLTLSSKKDDLIVTVKDQGIGIKKEDLPRVFEGFYKGKDNQKQGLGLGLFLAKSIIHEHRGNIVVTSKVGRGTTMKVTLPQQD